MKITTAELRRITEKHLRHLEETGVTSVEVEHDFYWSIPSQQLYNTEAEPSDLEVGQLVDDLEELRLVDRGEKEPIGYGLVWLGAVLRAVGEKVIS
jgi:hypothetical protein